MRALVIEDHPRISELVSRGLGEEGFVVDVAATAGDGVSRGTEYDYDVIVLDLMLPDRDGSRPASTPSTERWSPVLILTARDAVEDRVAGPRRRRRRLPRQAVRAARARGAGAGAGPPGAAAAAGRAAWAT